MYQFQTFQKPDQRYGPLQIVHDFQFVALNLTEDYTWPADAGEEAKVGHIRWRLQRLATRGYGGIVVNVANENYMEDDQAWRRLVETVDMAREYGLRIWIYDEQYYPSGSAGGLTLRGHPELEAQCLACVTRDVDQPAIPVRIASPNGHSSLKYAFAVPLAGDQPDFSRQMDISRYADTGGGLCWDCSGGVWRVYCFFTRALYEGTYLCKALRAPRRCINVCDSRAVKRFLDVTFDHYETWLGDRLGRDIETVFTDEPSLFVYSPYPEGHDPNIQISQLPTTSFYEKPALEIPIYPFIAWTQDLDAQFAANHGYALQDNLPLLFAGAGSSQAAQVSLDYYSTHSELFDQAYSSQYRSRLSRYGMNLSGHMLSEESLGAHPALYGDILRNLGRMDIPGCDLLFSEPGKLRHSIACKMASSAAHLYGRQHVMIEASNMCDQDQNLTLPALCCAMAIEFAHGVDTITSYYGENLFAEDEYAQFTACVARLGTLFDGGTHVSQALVYYPFAQIAACAPIQKTGKVNNHANLISDSVTGFCCRLLTRQLDFDFINDEKFAECTVTDGQIMTSGGESARILLLPAIDFLPAKTTTVIKAALAAGVTVAMAGQPHQVDGLEPNAGLLFLGDDIPWRSADFLTRAACPGLLCMHKRFANQELYLVVNTDPQPLVFSASIPQAYDHLLQLDLVAGTVKRVDYQADTGRLNFSLALAAYQAIVLCLE